MQKQARLILKKHPVQKSAVEVGTHVKPGDLLLHAVPPKTYKFNLSQILRIKPQKLSQYLKITPDSPVVKEQVIAQKGGFLHEQLVRSPVAGKFSIIDPEKGIVVITKPDTINEVTAYFPGVVIKIEEEKLVFEVTGKVLPAVSGGGEPAQGKLKVLDETSLLKLSTEIENCVIVVAEANPALIAKADTLGAAAVIAETVIEPPFSMPYLIFEKVTELKAYHDFPVLVLGTDKTLLVLEKGKPAKK